MSSALLVASEEGYRGEERIAPLSALDAAGFDITVATLTGGKPVLHDLSLDPEEVGAETAERVTEVHETDKQLVDAVPLAGEGSTNSGTEVGARRRWG